MSIDASITRFAFSLGALGSLLLAAGCSAPATFVRLRAAEADWRVIELRPGMEREKAWSELVDTVSLKHDIELLERDSGYVRSGWMFTLYPEYKDRYRTRVVAKMSPENDNIRVKIDAHWLPPGASHWQIGSDTAELDDVWADLQGVLGRVTR